MSKMSRLISDIQMEVETGELSFQQIADKYEVPVSWVEEALAMMIADIAED